MIPVVIVCAMVQEINERNFPLENGGVSKITI
jgi:hypothetical protein